MRLLCSALETEPIATYDVVFEEEKSHQGKRKMGYMIMNFPIVIYASEDEGGGRFTAHCLNMDVVALDDCVESAVSGVLETIEAALDAARKYNANPFRDAPKEYWDKLANAKPLPKELKERIIFNANKRASRGAEKHINVETQCDLRQLEPA